MKKTKKEKKFTTLDYMKFVDESWGSFHDTNKTGEKIDHLGNMIVGIWSYVLSQYDQDDFNRFTYGEPKEDKHNEGK